MKKKMLSLAVVGLALSCALVCAGCSGDGETTENNADSTGQTQQQTQTLRLGLSPNEDSAEVLKKYEAFTNYLAEATGMEVEPFVGADYTAVVEALNSGHLDVAWFGPSEYVLATDIVNSGVEAFAAAIQEEGSVPYQSMFIVKADSPMNSLEDIKGHSLAFTDPASTSGHIFGRYTLVQAGIDPEEDCSQVIFSGSQDACLLAVVNSQVEVGCVSSRNLQGFVESGMVEEDSYKVIATSVEIPPDPIAMRSDLPQETKDAIKEAFLNDTPELENALEGTGFAKFDGSVNDDSYQLVRDAYEVAGVTPEL